jgi:nucleoside 2-deoxyribosyltransferase
VRCVTGREHAAAADDDVVSALSGMIADCSALIAVVTGRNPNVFFEIGVASALSKPCLLLASRASDAAMLKGAYPIIAIVPPLRAKEELKRHIALWRLAKNPII